MTGSNIGPWLRGVAEVRKWMQVSIPGAASAAGLDTFLCIATKLAEGAAVNVDAVARELPYDSDQVRAQLRRMERWGLLEERAGGHELVATPKLLGLLAAYQHKLQGEFIVRQELRDEQLLVRSQDAALAAFAERLYDHFFDLGWLYLHRFGSMCFLMAMLVQRVALLHGHAARVFSGHVEVLSRDHHYRVGAPGSALQGQVEGHAMCIVDETLVVDFGLGVLRKGYRRGFYWGVVVDLPQPAAPAGPVLAEVATAPGELMRWRTDWRCPGTEAELAKAEPWMASLLAEYRERFAPETGKH